MQKQPETPSEIIKAARDKSDLTVEELTDRVGITERYLYRIENEGKVPTFEVLKKIVRELAIDGNLIFYPEKPVKDSEVEDLVRMLYSCDDRSLKIIRATIKAALESQTETEVAIRQPPETAAITLPISTCALYISVPASVTISSFIAARSIL